jgi:hypothetical protein
MATAEATDTDISSQSDHLPTICTTGVLLSEHQNVAQLQGQGLAWHQNVRLDWPGWRKMGLGLEPLGGPTRPRRSIRSISLPARA